jgi:hypothetical protein
MVNCLCNRGIADQFPLGDREAFDVWTPADLACAVQQTRSYQKSRDTDDTSDLKPAYLCISSSGVIKVMKSQNETLCTIHFPIQLTVIASLSHSLQCK